MTTPNPIPAQEIPPPTGKVQQWLTSMFGPSYRTTISGYAVSLGVALSGIGALIGAETPLGKKMLVAGAIFGIIGGQQMGQHSKDKAVIGSEPK